MILITEGSKYITSQMQVKNKSSMLYFSKGLFNWFEFLAVPDAKLVIYSLKEYTAGYELTEYICLNMVIRAFFFHCFSHFSSGPVASSVVKAVSIQAWFMSCLLGTKLLGIVQCCG